MDGNMIRHTFLAASALAAACVVAACGGASAAAHPNLGKPDLKMSVRRTLQALRIAVNDEFAALDALLRSLPS